MKSIILKTAKQNITFEAAGGIYNEITRGLLTAFGFVQNFNHYEDRLHNQQFGTQADTIIRSIDLQPYLTNLPLVVSEGRQSETATASIKLINYNRQFDTIEYELSLISHPFPILEVLGDSLLINLEPVSNEGGKATYQDVYLFNPATSSLSIYSYQVES